MTLRMQDKQAIVAQVAEIAKQALSVILADYRGLTVAEMTDLRNKARDANVCLQVVRNTLARRALQDTDFACLSDVLVGPLFLAFSLHEPSAAARLIRDFAKEHENLAVKALAIGGKLLEASELKALAELPTREQMLAMLMGAILAVPTKLASTMQESYAKLGRVLAVVHDQKQTG